MVFDGRKEKKWNRLPENGTDKKFRPELVKTEAVILQNKNM